MEGVQQSDEGEDKLSFATRGDFYEKDGCFYIVYEESEATGFAGNTTTLTIENESRVVLDRVGPQASQLIIERDKKHMCHYMTEFGDMVIGIRTEKIRNMLTDDGGDVSFRYTLDLNANELVTNELKITVRKLN